ncbi:MAG: replication-relaxation family protein [Anaerolineae bacterium]|nr:replication-relaxation family protein [Anaerolineae bacterium]
MRLTKRDKEIVEAVHRYRLLRQDQIEALFFGSRSATQRVLVRLYDHGFLERRFIPIYSGRSPTFYVLDRRGADLLRAELGYEDLTWHHSSKDLSADFLEHTLAINDVRIAVTLAARQPGYELLEWRSESDLKAGYDRVRVHTGTGAVRSIPIVPDSYFVVQTPLGRAPFFLEVDRGTETTVRFLTKVRAYAAYYASGDYERRFGNRSLRILTVTVGEKRRDNLQEVSQKINSPQRFLFAVAADVRAATVFSLPIWYAAGEREPQVLIHSEQRPD